MSDLADRFVSNPAEIVKVQQKVQVTVTEVDLDRKRIALSMRANPELSGDRPPRTESKGPRQPQNRDNRPPRNQSPSNDWFSSALDASSKRKRL